MAKIIIVEDDLKTANLYKERLEKEGYEVKVSADEAAFDTIKQEKPQLVLLDLLMPKVNGLMILRAIKTEPGLEDLPVLILTNVDGVKELSEAIAFGASGYLVKSETSLDVLANKVRSIVESESIASGVKG